MNFDGWVIVNILSYLVATVFAFGELYVAVRDDDRQPVELLLVLTIALMSFWYLQYYVGIGTGYYLSADGVRILRPATPMWAVLGVGMTATYSIYRIRLRQAIRALTEAREQIERLMEHDRKLEERLRTEMEWRKLWEVIESNRVKPAARIEGE